MSAVQTCPQCGAAVAGVEWTCSACGTNLSIAHGDTDRTVLRASVSAYPPPSPMISGIPPTRWPAQPAAAREAQSAPRQPAAVVRQPVTPAGRPGKLPGSPRWIPRAAVALAVLGTAGLVWFVVGSGDDNAATSGPSSSLDNQPIASTPAAADQPSTPTSTLPSTTIVETPTVVPASVFSPPTVPAALVLAGAGVAYSVADPLPSGLSLAEVQPALLVAQNVADLLASDQWDTARQFLFYLDGDTKSPTVEALVGQWGASDRLSLVLLDARKDVAGAGYNLLVGTIANLNDGSTSVLCEHLYAEADADPAVVDLGNDTVVTQGDAAFVPEQLLNAPDRIVQLQASCVWPS